MNLEDFIKDLSPELQEKARACMNVDDLISLAEEKGVPVPDEALDAIAGGKGRNLKNCHTLACPNCGSSRIGTFREDDSTGRYITAYRCSNCGYRWIP